MLTPMLPYLTGILQMTPEPTWIFAVSLAPCKAEDAADLPFLRRRNPGACILFVPSPCHAEMPGRLVTRGRHHAGMEDASARPRSPAACTHPPSRQRLAGAHRRLQADRRSVLSRPYRAAATRQADGAAGNRAAHKICPQTPRPPQAWCHVVANFAESGVISICSEF